MSNCIVRVELHNAKTAEQYRQLHSKLAHHGINDIIVANDGRRYRLPPAEYYYSGTASRDTILQTSKMCAASVDRSFAVVVSDTTSVTWEGLQPA